MFTLNTPWGTEVYLDLNLWWSLLLKDRLEKEEAYTHQVFEGEGGDVTAQWHSKFCFYFVLFIYLFCTLLSLLFFSLCAYEPTHIMKAAHAHALLKWWSRETDVKDTHAC